MSLKQYLKELHGVGTVADIWLNIGGGQAYCFRAKDHCLKKYWGAISQMSATFEK